jgi:hypothetical protein
VLIAGVGQSYGTLLAVPEPIEDECAFDLEIPPGIATWYIAAPETTSRIPSTGNMKVPFNALSFFFVPLL